MNYSGLKDAVRAVIKENGNEEITGDILQQTLIAIINALGFGYQFMGIATPDTDFGTPDSRQFYIATAPGTYGSTIVTLDGTKVAILLFADSWDAITLDVPTATALSVYLKISDLATSTGTGENTAMTQKATTEAIIAAINTALLKSDVVQSLGDDATKVLSQAAITTVLLGYAKIDGVYPDLVAGLAQNLVGRGSVLEEFNFAPTGGNADIGTGTARIKKLLGKSIVWNQKRASIINAQTQNGITDGIESETGYVTFDGTSLATTYAVWNNILPSFIIGHKYYFAFLFVSGYNSLLTFGLTNNPERSNNKEFSSIFTASAVGNGIGYQSFQQGTEIHAKVLISTVDLTLFFGSGKEPTTVEDFEKLYSLRYFAFNAGEIKNTTATGLKTNGFNQWNEQWEQGGYNTTTGNVSTAANRIRAKELFRVIPGKKYFINSPLVNNNNTQSALWCLFYDGNQNLIPTPDVPEKLDTSANAVALRGEFTVPMGACYMKFMTQPLYGGTYNNDICINISWSGYRNGEYEPYWENTLPIPITTMTGKLNGAGESVTIFPDGMKSVGSVYDETDGTNATKRIGTRAYQSGDENDSSVVTDGTNTNYVLSTPEEYVLDTPFVPIFKEDDFGTNQKLPADTASSVSAPLLIDVQYPMNAVDTLRRLSVNYISKESFDAFCAELATKLGAAIGKTITITSTFNAEQDKYNFTITIV